MSLSISRTTCRMPLPAAFAKDPLASELANAVGLLYTVVDTSPMVSSDEGAPPTISFEVYGVPNLFLLENKIQLLIARLTKT